MADKTAIEWTDATWNPIRARNRETGGVGHFCTHVSEGCRNCFSERLQPRFRNPVRFAAQDRDKVDIYLDEKVLTQPLRWKRGRKIFVCDMTDLFGEWVPDAWIDRIFAVMALAPQHTFQVLTKRPARMRNYLTTSGETFPGAGRNNDIASAAFTVRDLLGVTKGEMAFTNEESFVQDDRWPLPNVWLGTSVEDRATADERVIDLLGTPGALHFVSAEPLLGPIDFRNIAVPADWPRCDCENHTPTIDAFGGTVYCDGCCEGPEVMNIGRLRWIIAGGESGLKARPSSIHWFREMRDQCVGMEAAFFFKQWGEWAPHKPVAGGNLPGDVRAGRVRIIHPDGSSDVEVFQKTGGRNTIPGSSYMARVGKKTAGRMLDRRTWDEFPDAARS